MKNQISVYSFEAEAESNDIEVGNCVEICYGIEGIGSDDVNGDPDVYDKCYVKSIKESNFGYIKIEIISAFVFLRNNIKKKDKLAKNNSERIEGLGRKLVVSDDPIKLRKIDSDGEYGKGLWTGIVDWGTTGEPAGWTKHFGISSSTVEVIASENGHNYPIEFYNDNTANSYIDKTISGTYFSVWFKSSNATEKTSWRLIDGTNTIYLEMNADKFQIGEHSAADGWAPAAPFGTALNDAWYHLAIELDTTNNIAYYYLNGNLTHISSHLSNILTQTKTAFIMWNPSAVYTTHWDALVVSTTKSDMWSNFGAGHLQAESAYIKHLQVDTSNIAVKSCAIVQRTTAKTYASGAYYVAEFNDVIKDVGGDYNTTTFKFTCPVSGIY